MKQICVVGVGYVGLVTGACFADLGNRVLALDVDDKRIGNLKKGIMPIYEPGLDELVKRNVAAGRLIFTTSYAEALRECEFAFIAVGTPSGVNGEADLQYVASAAKSIARNMTAPLIIINKSTVPIGTGDWVADIIQKAQPRPMHFSVVSCPEFLREGSAIGDFMSPHRTVIGSLHHDAAEKVAQLHLALRAPIVITDLRTAEMIKYASNAFLATKISFMNELADLCESVGADIKEVAAGMGYDARIGRHFLDAGLGWGGSCFPKDVKALAFMAKERGPGSAHPELRHRSELRSPHQRGASAFGNARRPEGQDHRLAGAGIQAKHRRYARGAVDRHRSPPGRPQAPRCGRTTLSRWKWRARYCPRSRCSRIRTKWPLAAMDSW